MKALIIAGMGQAPGKTTLAAGLAHAWAEKGKRVCYLSIASPNGDADARFMADVFKLPVQAADQPAAPLTPELQAADCLLVEVAGDVAEPSVSERLSAAASTLDAAVVLVVGYRQRLQLGQANAVAQAVPGHWLGVVINAVPNGVLTAVASTASSVLDPAIANLGVLPEARGLAGFPVSDLASHLRATVVGHAPDGGLIDNLVVGSNVADPVGSYFGSRPGSAVFCRVDRPDIQLAALDSALRCLVLTGEGRPQQNVLHRAEDAGVAVLQVSTDTVSTVGSLTGFVETVRFRQRAKVPVIAELLSAHVSLALLELALGIA